jgi:PAS domain S-box-containing protein
LLDLVTVGIGGAAVAAVITWLVASRRRSGDIVYDTLSRLPQPVLSIGADALLIAANDPAHDLLGPLLDRKDRAFTREDLVQRGLRLEDIEGARVAHSVGQTWSGQVEVRAGESLLRLAVTVTPDSAGGVLIILRDYSAEADRQRRLAWEVDRLGTAQRGLEKQLEGRTEDLTRLSEQYFELFDNAPAFYLHLDEAQHIAVINSAGAGALGYESLELKGRGVYDLFEPDDQPRLRKLLNNPESLDPASPSEFRLIDRSGKTITVLLSGTTVPDAQGNAGWETRLTLVDIGTIKEHQLLLRRISAELEERNAVLELKNEEIARADKLKSEFLNNISHELRTPLHAVIGYAELIHSGGYGPTTELQRHGSAGILKRGEDLLGLINNLLDLSRIEAGRMNVIVAAFDPVAAVQHPLETTSMLVRNKRDRLKLRVIAEDAPRLVTGDEDMFKRVVMNLLSNASRFTERGSINVTIRRDGTQYVTAVSDTGVGISEDAQKFIFDEFRQVDGSTTREHGGSGLGLAICKKLCELMGGSISVTSRVGQGTTFYVRLPIHGEEVVAKADNKAREWTRHETTIQR